jgi:hypothetical protein
MAKLTKVEAEVVKGIWIIPLGMTAGALPLLRRPNGGIALLLFAVGLYGSTAACSLLLAVVFKRGLLSPLWGTILATVAYVVTLAICLAAMLAAVRIAPPN